MGKLRNPLKHFTEKKYDVFRLVVFDLVAFVIISAVSIISMSYTKKHAIEDCTENATFSTINDSKFIAAFCESKGYQLNDSINYQKAYDLNTNDFIYYMVRTANGSFGTPEICLVREDGTGYLAPGNDMDEISLVNYNYTASQELLDLFASRENLEDGKVYVSKYDSYYSKKSSSFTIYRKINIIDALDGVKKPFTVMLNISYDSILGEFTNKNNSKYDITYAFVDINGDYLLKSDEFEGDNVFDFAMKYNHLSDKEIEELQFNTKWNISDVLAFDNAKGQKTYYIYSQIVIHGESYYLISEIPENEIPLPSKQVSSTIMLMSLMVVFIINVATFAFNNRRLFHLQEQEKELRRHLNDRYGVISALGIEYSTVFMLDTMTKEAIPFKTQGFSEVGVTSDLNKYYFYDDIEEKYAKYIVVPEDREAFLREFDYNNITQIEAGKQKTLEYKGKSVDGLIHNLQAVITKVTDSENNIYIIAGFRNIDKVVEKKEKQRKQLAEALLSAENANKAKSIFLNNMSHDIRTPMNAIIGFTNIAQKNIENKEKVNDSLDKIMSSSQHLLNLINDVLDMSRIESGKMALEPKDTNLVKLIDDVANIVQANLTARQLEMSTRVVNLINPYVKVDQLKLNQVLLNLIGNSIKFTNPGGKIGLELSQLKSEGNIASYKIIVYDNGIGMSEEFQKNVFQAFERERTSTVSKIQGTGLGMSITKAIIDKMGGDISVKSKLNEGTEFTIILDLEIGCIPEDEQKKDKTPTNKVSFVGKRLLLVEDNELNREIAYEVLKEDGFEIETAVNGLEAVNIIKEKGAHYYDAILMDIQMPIMDGYEATQEIRKLDIDGIADQVIIAMTANAFKEDIEHAKACGMNGHIAKPIDIPVLEKTLAQLLK